MGIKKLSREEAYSEYRSNPADFFETRIHAVSKNESELISPGWHKYWTKYHYNLVENGILEILHDQGIATKKMNVLDVGVGTGHWLEFYRSLFDIRELWGVDFCEAPVQAMKERLSGEASLLVLDISAPLPDGLKKMRFDVINAIGVIFHIVDDLKWKSAIRNLVSLLDKDGVLIIGGDFGDTTKERGVMRKTRSIHEWKLLLTELNAQAVELKRYHWWAGADNDGITDNLLAIKRL